MLGSLRFLGFEILGLLGFRVEAGPLYSAHIFTLARVMDNVQVVSVGLGLGFRVGIEIN